MTISATAPQLNGLTLLHRGKVRDTWDLGDALLMVASDRISAFDVILPTLIPGKGTVLTQLSAFWFHKLARLTPHHLITADFDGFPSNLQGMEEALRGRAMIVRKANRVDIECVVRGYLAGSAWQEYRRAGTVAGQRLTPGMRQSEQLGTPLFTPAIKNDVGHDENISVAGLEARIGVDLAREMQRRSIALYEAAAEHARPRGVLIADTKFEFGFIDGELSLIDEVLTPDSSRFWDAAVYQPGGDPASFDKQFVRDWLLASGWDREPPGPELPAPVVVGTVARYREALDRLTGDRPGG